MGQLPQEFPVSTLDFERLRHTCTDDTRDDEGAQFCKRFPLDRSRPRLWRCKLLKKHEALTISSGRQIAEVNRDQANLRH
jgi:hypothetical protein